MATKKRNEEEIEAVRALLPMRPPDDVVEIVKKRMKANKLVYRCGYVRNPITGLREKAAKVTCTTCGKSYYLSSVSGFGRCHCSGYGDSFGFIDPFDNETKTTGSSCICDECGAPSTALHISHISNEYYIESKYFMKTYNIRGHFVALSWIIFKMCDKEGRVSYGLRRYEGIALIDGKPIRYTGYTKGFYGYWSNQWDTRAVWKDNCDEWDEDEIFMDRADFDASDASKSGLEAFIASIKTKIRVGAYLQLWSKYPCVENLVRSGLAVYVQNMIEKSTYIDGYYGTSRSFNVSDTTQYFDHKKVKPHEMLGCEKSDIDLARNWPVDRFRFYEEVYKTYNIRLTEDQLKDSEIFGFNQLRSLMKEMKSDLHVKIPFLRMQNYLVKQRNICGDIVSTQYLLDYWRMTREIRGELPEELIFPRDLKRAHDLAIVQKKVKTDKETDEKISAYAKTLSRLAFSDEETGLMIRPAESQDELIKEGKVLSHCVATYAEKVSERKTIILFIRKIADPEIPYFTLEYRDGIVQQNRGSHNCARTPEVQAFEDKWLTYINQIKGDKKDGKLVGIKTAAVAGA